MFNWYFLPAFAAMVVFWLLAARRVADSSPTTSELAPSSQAQALRAVLEASILQLKPAGPDGKRGTPRDLQYNILRDEYLLERSNVQIMTRYSLSESTFHRKGREAIGALARELKQREEFHSQAPAHAPEMVPLGPASPRPFSSVLRIPL